MVLDYGALKINAEYRSVESNGELVQLTNYEFEILYLLAKNPGRIFSKEQIYTQDKIIAFVNNTFVPQRTGTEG